MSWLWNLIEGSHQQQQQQQQQQQNRNNQARHQSNASQHAFSHSQPEPPYQQSIFNPHWGQRPPMGTSGSPGFSIVINSGNRPQTQTWHTTTARGVPSLIQGPGSILLAPPTHNFATHPTMSRGPPPIDPLGPVGPRGYSTSPDPAAPLAALASPDSSTVSPLYGPVPGPSAVETAKCFCCASRLKYPRGSNGFRCTICGTVWDLVANNRGRGDVSGVEVDRSIVNVLADLAAGVDLRGGGEATRQDVAWVGDGKEQEGVALAPFSADKSENLSGQPLTSNNIFRNFNPSSTSTNPFTRPPPPLPPRPLSLQVPPQPPRNSNSNEFLDLAITLLSALFSSARSLSTAFVSRDGSLDIPLLDAFYDAIMKGPGGRDALAQATEQFLKRPGKDVVDTVEGGSDTWVWAVVLLENPLLGLRGNLPAAQRSLMLAKALGMISSLPNPLHHELVSLLSSPGYHPSRFEAKIDLINAFIAERVSYYLSAGGLPGQPPIQLSPNHYKSTSTDWSLRAASRVMALFFGANTHRPAPRLPITAFYNLTLDLVPPLAQISDFEAWEQRASQPGSPSNKWQACSYPFLLTLAAKITLLTYEGKRSMGHEARQAWMDGILGRRLSPPVLVIEVRRERIVQDSLREIEAAGPDLKKLLKISFVNEEGLDGGGLKKEWFLLLCRQLLDPQYGMFVPDEGSGTLWFNPAAFEAASEFRLVGVILGLAIYNRATLDVRFPIACYKKLLDAPVGFEDLKAVKPDLAKGLESLLAWDDQAGNGTVEDVFCRTMVGDYEAFGDIVEVPLYPGGERVVVTKDNREDYVKRFTEFVLTTSIAPQFESFSQGFNLVASGNALSLFRPEELDLLIRGSPEPLDFTALRSVTVYEGFPRGAEDTAVSLFWRFFESLDDTEQKKLLAFVTGSDRLPATGTSAMTFKITKWGDADRLPTSQTCFNQLLLPNYSRLDVLEDKFRQAMEESEGFALQ